ncbi:MAG: hypothetical protein AUI47_02540 [Acidobacteria bacterium 13_1_40CM_2_68_5]|nr:MAG: hypothetical protein AUI47_02540 [Acidobacteria bacterium 13_1_40CM_2_68_5]
MGGIGRLEILAALISTAGIVLCARGSWRLLQAVRARFTYGAPYRSGTIQDRLLGLLLEIPVLLFGAGLAFVALAQADFQPSETTVRVGQIEARRSGWAKVSVRLVPDPLYPSGRLLEGEIVGARWAVAGDFITWDRSVKWLGLRDGHRVRYLIGANDIPARSAARRGRTPDRPDTLPAVPEGQHRDVLLVSDHRSPGHGALRHRPGISCRGRVRVP